MTLLTQEIIHSACYAPSSFIIDLACAQMLHIDKRWRYAAIMTVLHAAPQILFGWMQMQALPGAHAMNTIAQLVLYFLVPVILSRDSLPRKIFAPAICLAAALITSTVAEMVFIALGGQIQSTVALVESDPAAYVAMFLISYVLLSIVLPFVITLWSRALRDTADRSFWYYTLFPASQMLALTLAIQYTSLDAFVPSRHIPLLIVVLFCAAADVLLFRTIRIHSRRAVDAARAEWLEQLLDQQQDYYEHILAEQADAAKIRHDIRNQLQTAYSLVESGDREAARAQLDEIRAVVEPTAPFCENRVVNALLRVKAERFAASDIRFDCRCRLPENFPVKGTELCSLFSNVLDNAFRAAAQYRGEDPAVALDCDVHGDVLSLRCVNSCPPTDTPAASGHGLGLEILRDLARRHNGEVTAERDGASFTTQVQLLAE